MFKTAKFFTTVGFLVILALVGGLYISGKKAANQEPITIFKIVTPTKTTKVSKIAPTKTNPSFHVSPPSKHIHEHAPHEHIYDSTEDFSVNLPKRGLLLSEGIEKTTDFKGTEELNHEDSVDEDFDPFQQAHEQIERLASQIQAEYPELLELQNMTLEEMDALSEAEKERISELSLRFQAEYLGEIQTLLSRFPSAHLEGILSALQETYDQQWGTEFADQLVSEMRTYLQQ